MDGKESGSVKIAIPPQVRHTVRVRRGNCANQIGIVEAMHQSCFDLLAEQL